MFKLQLLTGLLPLFLILGLPSTSAIVQSRDGTLNSFEESAEESKLFRRMWRRQLSSSNEKSDTICGFPRILLSIYQSKYCNSHLHSDLRGQYPSNYHYSFIV